MTGVARATVDSTLYTLVGKGTLASVELPGGNSGYRLAEPGGDD
jgi:hypothetical protein